MLTMDGLIPATTNKFPQDPLRYRVYYIRITLKRQLKEKLPSWLLQSQFYVTLRERFSATEGSRTRLGRDASGQRTPLSMT
jgi:hypothetical protein